MMKHPFLQRLAAAVCALLLALALCPTAQAAAEPAVSSNRNKNCYGAGTANWYQTVKSYLYENPSGGLTRVEYLGDQKIIAEDYSSSFQLQSSRTIPFELSVWGGFFAGQSYNFLIFGQNNPNDSDSVETLRVVKYDKSWNRLGQYSLYGGDIYKPFEAGSLRCTEYSGYLYIHSCRQMYADAGGTHHQANLTLHLRESDMSCLQYKDVFGSFVSHSFNQFILVDSDQNVVILDHGDANPRAIVLTRYTTKAGAEPLGFYDSVYSETTPIDSMIYEFAGTPGDNATNATVGALAETSTGYVTAFARNDEAYGSGSATRKIYLGYTHKSDLASSWVLVSSDRSVSTPQLAPTGLDGGYVLWNAMDDTGFYIGTTLHYASYNANGTVGAMMTAEGAPLSDCAPILYNGKSVWYTTDNSVPTFYALDASGVTATKANGSTAALGSYLFSDVPTTHWAYSSIKEMVDRGLANGVGDGRFEPSGEMTSAEFSTLLARAFYGEPTQTGDPWYVPYRDMLARHFLYTYTDCGTDKNIVNPISRYNMAQLIYNILKDKHGDIPSEEKLAAARVSIRDWASVPENYQEAVAACYAAGLIGGMEDGSFNGDGAMTRAQGCTVLSRTLAYLPQSAAVPSEAEQTYYSVEEFSAEVVRLTNEERAKRGLPALAVNQGLMLAAQIRAEELAVQRSTTRPNGHPFNNVLSQIGFTDDEVIYSSENQFWGTFSTPQSVKEIWERTPSILERIYDPRYTHIGVGFYRADDGQVYCVQFLSELNLQNHLSEYRTGVVRVLNQLRAERGLPALQESETLTHAAEVIAMGSSQTASVIVHQDLRASGYNMVMSSSYSGSINTPDQVLSLMRMFLKDNSPVFDSTITHAGIGFWIPENGNPICVMCFAQIQ